MVWFPMTLLWLCGGIEVVFGSTNQTFCPVKGVSLVSLFHVPKLTQIVSTLTLHWLHFLPHSGSCEQCCAIWCSFICFLAQLVWRGVHSHWLHFLPQSGMGGPLLGGPVASTPLAISGGCPSPSLDRPTSDIIDW